MANFETGITDFNTIFELETPYILVISSGKCFIINPDKTQPIEIFGGDYINYLTSNDGRIILYNDTRLTVIDSKGNHWDSEKISFYGLVEMKISENNIITGLFYEPTPTDDLWIPFEYNIDTKSFLYDKSIIRPCYKKFNDSFVENKKPWWKFW
ncbi:hypothetical protein O2K51_07255 [Apibacter raozihei]|uniref:hypothetical protein n=1 Tax=Apibacter raozihei TaxID=2500547 RepID=UPI000FE2CD18|nr:hypothetical protein [Apibacter raozihei]